MKSLLFLAAFAQTLAALPPGATLVEEGSSTAIRDQRVEVCNDQKSWRFLWLAHNSHLIGGQAPQPATVNFADEVVVAIYLGERSMGGYAVKLVSVADNNGDTIITFEEETPSGFVLQALNQPYLIVTVKRPTGKLVVIEKGVNTPQLVEDFAPQVKSAPPSTQPQTRSNAGEPTGEILIGFIAILTLLLGLSIALLARRS